MKESSLLEAIARISRFSYKSFIVKYPFLKEYLGREKDPENEWVLWMTAAGAGYALSTKEVYPGEHDELIKSVATIDKLVKFVKNFAIFIRDVYKNNRRFYPIGIGFWVLSNIKEGKPTTKEVEGLGQDIGKVLSNTIHEYEAEKVKNLDGR